ncbi:hypothetical protein, partial [Shinella sp. G-2]|uniref:hypothetical protein n=1 Tax=Shinella sp. G-2 TaxID=3133141 RepID=UPI003D050762
SISGKQHPNRYNRLNETITKLTREGVVKAGQGSRYKIFTTVAVNFLKLLLSSFLAWPAEASFRRGVYILPCETVS